MLESVEEVALFDQIKSRKLDNMPPFGAPLTMESGNYSSEWTSWPILRAALFSSTFTTFQAKIETW